MASAKNATSKQSPAKKKARKKKQKKASDDPVVYDPMSECASLCQQGKWREALILCRNECEKADNEGNKELSQSLNMAQSKIEYSLRRQIAATLINSGKKVLAKEYLLDVGE